MLEELKQKVYEAKYASSEIWSGNIYLGQCEC